jgi:hypothetical protein
MAKIRTIEELREAIRDLEHQDYVNQQHMRQKVNGLAERLKPLNIVKNLLGHVLGGATDLKGNLFRMGVGLATSFLVKKIFKRGISR